MSGADPRVVFLRRAARVIALYRGGRMNTDAAFEALIHPFLEIVGPAAALCKICGDPPWRHDESWCTVVREGEARRAAERAQPKPERPTPRPTIDAIKYAVRTEGLAALREDPGTRERLSRCDARAKEEINEWIDKLLQARAAA